MRARSDARLLAFGMRNTSLTLVLLSALFGCGSSGAQTASTTPVQTSEAESAPPASEPAVTSTTPSASGDPLARYAHDVMAVVSRHWTVPQTIPREVMTHLEARIQIDVDANRFPTAGRIAEGSGNAVFDESVTRALADLVLAHEALPPAPTGLEEFGVVRLRLRGR